MIKRNRFHFSHVEFLHHKIQYLSTGEQDILLTGLIYIELNSNNKKIKFTVNGNRIMN